MRVWLLFTISILYIATDIDDKLSLIEPFALRCFKVIWCIRSPPTRMAVSEGNCEWNSDEEEEDSLPIHCRFYYRLAIVVLSYFYKDTRGSSSSLCQSSSKSLEMPTYNKTWRAKYIAAISRTLSSSKRMRSSQVAIQSVPLTAK
jgi:hypothetical protein